MKAALVLTLLVTLAACQQSPAENTADALDNAAAQSDPAAAASLENAADAMRDSPEDNVSAQSQNAMSAAGAAQSPGNRP